MTNIIQQICENFIKNILSKFEDQQFSISEAECAFLQEAKGFTAEAMQIYVEQIDAALLQNKKDRKEAGFVVERRDDIRKLETQIGEIAFRRTYYYNEKAKEYSYLADQVVGLECHARISDGLSLSLVQAAQDMSYQKACNHLTQGRISRQTVMHKLRKSQPVPEKPAPKKRAAVLHIDADEAHITLCGGKKSIVPLISVYEGIEKQGKRNICKNVCHLSEYGKKNEELWEHFISKTEEKYELGDTKFYLHADGANWIQEGLEWLPNATFVLDKYHKNKAIKAMTAGLDNTTRKMYEKEMREALFEEDIRLCSELTASLISQLPERAEIINTNSKYLVANVKGISICKKDVEANNGGCTEPHVSHVLASRLSSRPMAWSKQTLKQMAPLLASRNEIEFIMPAKVELLPLQRKAARAASKAFRCKGSAILTHPDSIGNIPTIQNGKIISIYSVLKSISKPL